MQKFPNGNGQISNVFFAVGLENANYEEDLAPYARIVAYRIYQTKLTGNIAKQEVE